ncbi:inner membrane-spanning protein YciB [Pseudaestuariivita rosea]|uniref:inner membrane-spanning protein YciB n=1 Tax=Pseudaestuariivita rosea TaxID=2763263 RepID=UPI001ABAF0EB|nr:inner membrane-spanning protein YciB [Pseudaestuariivita rosea]
MEKQINPTVKMVLELGPPILFFIIYMRLRDQSFTFGTVEYSGFIVSTLIFVPILLTAMAILWWLTGKLSRMQIFTAIMVIFFGGLTAWFNNEAFFKMKTTLVYGVFAGILGIGLLQGKSYLQFVLSEALPMKDEGWMIFTKRLTLAFVVLAVANEIIWRTMSTDLWVKIETFGFPLATLAFLWWQIMALQDYIEMDDQK